MTRERSREFVTDVRAFLHEHRVLTDQQMEELNTRYGEPAKAKAKELRETMERKFDEIAKEFETRVEQLETEINTRLGRNAPETATAAETPGEMPSGDNGHAHADESSTKKKSKKTQ
jgi:F0F1-type ATP synthase membrane subunit b/b'